MTDVRSATAATAHDERPLAGLRILELGGSVPVAAATRQLSDYGADVVVVEPPRGGAVRRLGPFPDDVPDRESGAFHVALNTGKRSALLGLESPSGLAVLGRLAEASDLVLLHLPAAEAVALRERIRALAAAPHVVVMTDHGVEGPFASRRENGTSLFAWTGRMRQHSLPGEEPLRYAPYVPEMQWGATAAAVALACLWSSGRGGERRDVEVAGVEALAGNVDTWFLHWEFHGIEWPRQRGQSRSSYPTGPYRCKDGHVVFASPNPPFYTRLLQAIGRPDLLEDPRFTDPLQKPAHFEEFFAILDAWLMERTREEVFTHLQAHGVMVAPVLDVPELLADRQAVARGSFVQHPLPGGGETLLPGPPFRIHGAWEARPAPRLGEHTDEVLRELGYTVEERLALFRAGVTG